MGDENVLELASVDGSQTCEYTKKKSLNCRLQEKSLPKITEKSLKFAVSKYKGHKETQKWCTKFFFDVLNFLSFTLFQIK